MRGGHLERRTNLAGRGPKSLLAGVARGVQGAKAVLRFTQLPCYHRGKSAVHHVVKSPSNVLVWITIKSSGVKTHRAIWCEAPLNHQCKHR